MRSARLRSFVLLLAFLTLCVAVQAQTALQFMSVVPCRVADTRNADGPFGGPAITGQSSRDFIIPNSACNIPSTATAYALNVTVVPHEALGYLTVWPAGLARPVISTLNSLDGRTKANAAVVPAGSGGAISVFATNTTDVVLDINGYFVPASSSTLAFFPLTPCRVADTRNPQGPLGAPPLTGGQERDFPVLSSACNIPDNAQGYSLNFTVVPSTPLGYLSVWPTGHSRPVVSTLNALTAAVTANAAIVPAGLSGAISVYASNDTGLVIDIDGYLAPPAPGLGGLSLYTLSPCRVLDTRPGNTFSGMIPVMVLESLCGVPSAQAYVVNATAVPKDGQPLGYLTLWPDAEGQPLVSTLNAMDGMVTSNMAIVPTLNGDIDAFASNSSDLVVDIFSYFAPIMPLSITTTALPSATVRYNYTTALGAAGGVTPYNWTVISGGLPSGLSLAPASGAISGIPTLTGTYVFTVQVSDAETPPVTANAPLSITVNSTLTTLSIMTTSLPLGTQNSSYNAMLAATGGVTPYTWSVSSGVLPGGLNLNSSTGAITGTPTGAGVSSFTVQVSDAENPAATASKQLSIAIDPAVPLSITTTSLPSGTAGAQYSAPITAIGGVYPYTWSISNGSLPSGLSLKSSTGVITGTPTGLGTSNFTVQVTDAETPPVSTTAQLSIVINPGGGNPGALSGHYAFYLNGWNSSTAWTLAGSFISDGHGNITSGVLDGNFVTGQPFTANVSGSYSISATGLNTITLQGSSYGPVTFAFVLDSSGNGSIIEYDDTTGQGSRGSGALRKANSSAFSLSALNGSWVYGMTGASPHGARVVNVGQFTLSSGNYSGTCDQNHGGTYETCTYTGSVSAVDPQTGRAIATTQVESVDTHSAIYVVSTSEWVMESIDPVQQTGVDAQAGSGLRQSGTFNRSSLNGLAVVYMQDIHAADGLDQSSAGIISFNGNGNYNMSAMDEDLAGTITQNQPSQGTYSVQANGAVTITCSGGCPVGFMISQNKAFLVGTGSNSVFGILEPQTGGPFSNASIAGTYVAGTLVPLDYANAKNQVFAAAADGSGNMVGNGDESGSEGLKQSLDVNISYNISSNGRGTIQAQGDHQPSIIYVISPTKSVFMSPKTDAELSVLGH